MSLLSDKRRTNYSDYIAIQLGFIQEFFIWWYIDIPTYLLGLIERVNIIIFDVTSLLIIVKGYLKPWKNDYNIAGWIVGIITKTVYIPIALFIIIVVNAFMVGLLLLQLVLLPLILAMIVINPLIAA